MEATRRAELVQQYRDGSAVVERALAGLTEGELDHRPADGGWSPREVAHHLADSEMTAAIRLRRLLAEDDPLIQSYDEEEFSRRLHYSSRPIEPSIRAMRGARETTEALLERLNDDDWGRSGSHSESGPYSVQTWLEIYAAHAHDHAEQIARAVGERRGEA